MLEGRQRSLDPERSAEVSNRISNGPIVGIALGEQRLYLGRDRRRIAVADQTGGLDADGEKHAG